MPLPLFRMLLYPRLHAYILYQVQMRWDCPAESRRKPDEKLFPMKLIETESHHMLIDIRFRSNSTKLYVCCMMRLYHTLKNLKRSFKPPQRKVQQLHSVR